MQQQLSFPTDPPGIRTHQPTDGPRDVREQARTRTRSGPTGSRRASNARSSLIRCSEQGLSCREKERSMGLRMVSLAVLLFIVAAYAVGTEPANIESLPPPSEQVGQIELLPPPAEQLAEIEL